ncbi:MAG: GerW family sporulation protein [Oscillospiraceae bacterium]|nr:GerW family sporulation protein [Oscillospiraceae bacterium]
MKEHPIQGMMGTAMEKIKEMVDVNTIIGDPIISPDGTTIIPISKVGFGFGSGGSDIPAKTPVELFGGGCGAGVSIQPIAFLVVSKGDVKLLQLNTNDSTADKAVEMVPKVMDKLYEIFSKSREEKNKIKSEKEKISEDDIEE